MSARGPERAAGLMPWIIAAAIVAQVGGCAMREGTDGTARAAVVPTPPSVILFPDATWTAATPEEAGMDSALLAEARDYALTGGGSGFIVRHGRRVYAWGDLSARFELKSATKSVGSILLGLALRDGLVRLDDRAKAHLPSFGLPPRENATSGWLDDVTLLHLATMTAGFEKPGGFGALLHEPGARWRYTDGGTNWLADVLTQAYGQDLEVVLFDRVMTPIGIPRERLGWRSNAYRPVLLNGVARREFGSGITTDVESLARIGYLFLRGGLWSGQRLLDETFIELARRPVPALRGLPVHDPVEWRGASDQYGLLWWTNGDGHLSGVPRDTFWAHGLGDALLFVIPSLDLVVARLGQEWPRGAAADRDVLLPFIGPIARSVD